MGWGDFPAKPTYSVWWRGELLQGQLRKRLLGCMRVERLKGYLVQMLARKKMVEEEIKPGSASCFKFAFIWPRPKSQTQNRSSESKFQLSKH